MSVRAALQSAHTHQIKTLYRQTIKLILNWEVDRCRWRSTALIARNKFEANRNLKEAGEISVKVAEAKTWIQEHWHPEPYIVPTQEGGTSFQRNVAPPVSILSVPTSYRPHAGGHH